MDDSFNSDRYCDDIIDEIDMSDPEVEADFVKFMCHEEISSVQHITALSRRISSTVNETSSSAQDRSYLVSSCKDDLSKAVTVKSVSTDQPVNSPSDAVNSPSEGHTEKSTSVGDTGNCSSVGQTEKSPPVSDTINSSSLDQRVNSSEQRNDSAITDACGETGQLLCFGLQPPISCSSHNSDNMAKVILVMSDMECNDSDVSVTKISDKGEDFGPVRTPKSVVELLHTNRRTGEVSYDSESEFVAMENKREVVKRRKHRPLPPLVLESSSSDDEDDTNCRKACAKSSTGCPDKKQVSLGLSHQNVTKSKSSPYSSDEEIKTPAKRSRRLINSSSESNSDSDIAIGSSHKKARKLKDSDESEVESLERKSRRRLQMKNDEISGADSEEDIASDEVDETVILSSDEEKHGRRRKKMKNQLDRQRKLKLLKTKNWKDRGSVEDSGYRSNTFKRIQTPTTADSSQECQSDEDRNSHQDSSSSDTSMDEFIEDEDVENRGPPLKDLLPQMFHKNISLEEAFRHFMSVYVNGALDPDFLKPEYLQNHYDSLIKASVVKIEDMIKAKANLLFSAAWKPEFLTALQTKPRLTQSDDEAPCDCEACGRSDHPGRKYCQFSGPVYDRITLEETNPHHTETDDSQEVQRSDGEEVFYIGIYCARRSRFYHRLYHFKFNLLQCCKTQVDYVKENRLYRDDADIFKQCMEDQKWMRQTFERLERYLTHADYYATEEKLPRVPVKRSTRSFFKSY